MIRDYKPQATSAKRGDRIPGHIHLLALVCGSIVAVLAFALPSERGNHRFANPASELQEIAQIPLDLPNPSETALPASEARHHESALKRWHIVTVRPGDSLTLIFSRLGLKSEDLYRLISADAKAQALTEVHPGQIFKIRQDAEGGLLELVHEANRLHGLRIVRQGDVFKTSEYTHEVEKRTDVSAGIIAYSLYQSAANAGLSDRLIMQLVEIFGWDIDFALDIRPGDSFAVVYEEDYFAGEKVGDGDILAAEFTNRGKTYRAVRYTNPEGVTEYYTPEGRGMRQAFLRSPVDFRRISSHFQPSRWHPVLGKKRPHRGVDYAAATGTPIKAAGDGRVIFIGKKGGYGNAIILQHRRHYTTLYGHMSRFNKELRRGDVVQQGDIIGYVGMTGLATGPHLHYEFRIDGVHQDPVTVELPGSFPIEQRYLTDFRKSTAAVVAQLEVLSRTQLAMSTQ